MRDPPSMPGSRRGSPIATQNEQDAATGKASVDRVRSTLSALPADAMFAQPNMDLQRAAMAALVLVDRARHGERPARFVLLPAALFAANASKVNGTRSRSLLVRTAQR
ncbi:MAG: hypothetical protein KF850_39510 [Labilithrix sp.]|nr:hypothetical protein [Labilithrix sp.]